LSQTSQNSAGEPKSSYGRRSFIKQSVVSLGVTVKEYVKHRDASPPKKEERVAVRSDWLRPPGAVEESLFLDRCTSCGDCVSACPYGSIRNREVDETPVIFSNEIPCYLCGDFPCIAACETEALLPVGELGQVKMGLAVVSFKVCTAEQGCNACVSQCPTQALTMDFSSFRIRVNTGLCVGCGICEQTCKTVNDRIAIKVVPTRLLEVSP